MFSFLPVLSMCLFFVNINCVYGVFLHTAVDFNFIIQGLLCQAFLLVKNIDTFRCRFRYLRHFSMKQLILKEG